MWEIAECTRLCVKRRVRKLRCEQCVVQQCECVEASGARTCGRRARAARSSRARSRWAPSACARRTRSARQPPSAPRAATWSRAPRPRPRRSPTRRRPSPVRLRCRSDSATCESNRIYKWYPNIPVYFVSERALIRSIAIEQWPLRYTVLDEWSREEVREYSMIHRYQVQ